MAFWVVEVRGFAMFHWSVLQTTDSGGRTPSLRAGKVVAGPFGTGGEAETDVGGRYAVQEVLEVFERAVEAGGLSVI